MFNKKTREKINIKTLISIIFMMTMVSGCATNIEESIKEISEESKKAWEFNTEIDEYTGVTRHFVSGGLPNFIGAGDLFVTMSFGCVDGNSNLYAYIKFGSSVLPKGKHKEDIKAHAVWDFSKDTPTYNVVFFTNPEERDEFGHIETLFFKDAVAFYRYAKEGKFNEVSIRIPAYHISGYAVSSVYGLQGAIPLVEKHLTQKCGVSL